MVRTTLISMRLFSVFYIITLFFWRFFSKPEMLFTPTLETPVVLKFPALVPIISDNQTRAERIFHANVTSLYVHLRGCAFSCIYCWLNNKYMKTLIHGDVHKMKDRIFTIYFLKVKGRILKGRKLRGDKRNLSGWNARKLKTW